MYIIHGLSRIAQCVSHVTLHVAHFLLVLVRRLLYLRQQIGSDSLDLDPPGARERGVERHAFARRVRALDANVDVAALASRVVGHIARCLTPRDKYHHLLFCTFRGGARVHARGAKHRVLDASQIALPNAGVRIGDRWISEKTVDYF